MSCRFRSTTIRGGSIPSDGAGYGKGLYGPPPHVEVRVTKLISQDYRAGQRTGKRL